MTTDAYLATIAAVLQDIAAALKPTAAASEPDDGGLGDAVAAYWDAAAGRLVPVARVSRIPLELLKGVDDMRDTLLRNTTQFAKGFGANNALLWGARGMGKSSLVKAVHAHVLGLLDSGDDRLVLVEIAREDLETLPVLMRIIGRQGQRFIVFCDDLSFDRDEASYKSLKTILDGGLEGRPENVLFYATSNRRHLMPRDMIDNERSSAINPNEAIDEKISLSDRFGLWLGFHQCDQDTYLAMVQSYAEAFALDTAPAELRARAIEWAAIRGSRSGRVAIQFIRQLAGETGKSV